MVGVAFVHLAFSRGIRGAFYVFYVVWLETFGWSRAATAVAISLSHIFEGLSFPFVGSLTDRVGPRRTLILGGFVLAFGLGLSATISSLWELYLWVGVVTALGLGLISQVPHVAILSREYSENRGVVLGIAFAGAGVGIMLLVPLTQVMVGSWGWPMAYAGLAGLAVLLVIPSARFFVPLESGPSVSAGKAREGKTDWTVGQALVSPVFLLLFVSRVLASTGNSIVTTHQIAHVVDIGYTKLFAATVFGFMGISSIFGRLFFGYLSDHMRRDVVFTLVQIVSSLGVVSLMLLKDTFHPGLLYAYAFFYGLGQGSRALVLSAISADLFLGRSFGAIYGYFTLSIGIGGAFGAWFGGFLYDVMGSYFVAFLISLACFVVSLVSVCVVTRMARSVK
ncbi:MAG: MFS transporter [Candidatus Binatia bacterium]